MKRCMMQVYVKSSKEAVEMYKQAFGAELKSEYKDDDGNYIHAELHIGANVLSLSEADGDRIAGTTMQFCFHYNEEEKEFVRRAYEILKEGGNIIHPLGECFYSSYMCDFIDKFGVHWCLFI